LAEIRQGFVMPVTTQSNALSHYGVFDIVSGALIIAVAAAFLVFMQIRTGTGRLGSYELTVQIPNAAGLKLGSDVRLSGVKVGHVIDLLLGQGHRFALVRISVRDDLAIPTGSSFSIIAPPMSDPYLSIKPGRGPDAVPQGSLIGQPAPLRPEKAPSPAQAPSADPAGQL
jgi:phospholipid/cholesterol/gamma-HCH transport system substrate-binding protein